MSCNNNTIPSDKEQHCTHSSRQNPAEKTESDNRQSRDYKRFMGILPAFRHISTGETHLSCDKDGMPAPTHRVDFLPTKWLSCNGDKSACKLKDCIEKGYVVMGHFFNQEDAAHLLPH